MRVRGRGSPRYCIRARYVLGCDGAAGVTRDQIGAHYVGRSDPRPNFNVVFRAPSFDTQLGPAVQYWVLGATSGLVGRLDLAGTWWAVIPGIEAAYGAAHASELITALLGHALLATEDPAHFAEAEKVLKLSVDRDREDPLAWYALGTVYAQRGDEPHAALATAERYAMDGNDTLARANAETALRGIPQGTPDYLRAEDIAETSRNNQDRRTKRR